jgi:2-dehydro-3-deoxyphosphogluconate aldolase / (4S)-4-hydroxy-2-oxoglutarate aldolase
MILEQATRRRIVPVVVIQNREDALPLAEALLAGGLDVIEITFRTLASEPAIRDIVRRYPDMVVGAGTLLDVDQVAQAVHAGAQFGVAPGLNRKIVAEARRMGLPFVPGVMTPSEVEAALDEDCKVLKFFPANLGGGVPMLKALTGPYARTGVRFIALGGVTPANMREFLDLPVVAAVGGTWIVDPKLIAARDWGAITKRVEEALAIVASGH